MRNNVRLFYMLYNYFKTRLYFHILPAHVSFLLFSYCVPCTLPVSLSPSLASRILLFQLYILYISLYFISFREIYLLFSDNIHNRCISLSFSIKCTSLFLSLILSLPLSLASARTQYSVYFPYSVSFPFIHLHIAVSLLYARHTR